MLELLKKGIKKSHNASSKKYPLKKPLHTSNLDEFGIHLIYFPVHSDVFFIQRVAKNNSIESVIAFLEFSRQILQLSELDESSW